MSTVREIEEFLLHTKREATLMETELLDESLTLAAAHRESADVNLNQVRDVMKKENIRIHPTSCNSTVRLNQLLRTKVPKREVEVDRGIEKRGISA